MDTTIYRRLRAVSPTGGEFLRTFMLGTATLAAGTLKDEDLSNCVGAKVEDFFDRLTDASPEDKVFADWQSPYTGDKTLAERLEAEAPEFNAFLQQGLAQMAILALLIAKEDRELGNEIAVAVDDFLASLGVPNSCGEEGCPCGVLTDESASKESIGAAVETVLDGVVRVAVAGPTLVNPLNRR